MSGAPKSSALKEMSKLRDKRSCRSNVRIRKIADNQHNGVGKPGSGQMPDKGHPYDVAVIGTGYDAMRAVPVLSKRELARQRAARHAENYARKHGK